jgi:transposase-like protein
MKTQLSKPARHKARYTEEYKKEALELWRASGRSAAKVAAELGILVLVGRTRSVRLYMETRRSV